MWRRSIDGFRHPSIYLFGAKKRVCGPAHCHSGWSLSSAAPTRRRGVGREPSALGSDYFTFADKLEATLRGIGCRQVREAEEQAAMINSLLVDPGWHYCLLDKKNEGETDSWSDTDEESGRDDEF